MLSEFLANAKKKKKIHRKCEVMPDQIVSMIGKNPHHHDKGPFVNYVSAMGYLVG